MPRKYTVKSKLTDSGFPTHSRLYKPAHNKADIAEKAKFPKGYEKMKKVDRGLSAHQLAGKNTKAGKILVSSRVPKSLRKEVAFHEKFESKTIKKMSKRRR